MLITLVWWMVCFYMLAQLFIGSNHSDKKVMDETTLLPHGVPTKRE